MSETSRKSWKTSLLLSFFVVLAYLASTKSTRTQMQEMKLGLYERTGTMKYPNETTLPPLSLGQSTNSSEFRTTKPSPDPFFAEPTSRRKSNPKDVVTIVVQLSGELGNHMYKIANGMCVKHQIETRLGLKTELKFRGQENPKWRRAMESITEAFPKTRPLDFRAGNTEEYDRVHLLQEQWLQHLIMTDQLNLSGVTDPSVMHDYHKGSHFEDVLTLLNQTWYLKRPVLASNNFSIPHVYANRFAGQACIELVLDDLKEFFSVDEDAICRQLPDPDENVLHLRNYLVELPTRGREKGFEQLDANKTATEIFANYKPGDKVAIISRFEEDTDKYIHALKTLKGVEARYIKGQTGNQDFCFLMKAQQEVVAQRLSTFASWASILGNAKKVRLYSVNSNYTRANNKHFYNTSWNVKELKDRIVYENYKVHG